MKSFKVLLMVFAVVIAVGGAFATKSASMAVSVWVSPNMDGSAGQNADINVAGDCSISNNGARCKVTELGPHYDKFIFNNGTSLTPLKKPNP